MKDVKGYEGLYAITSCGKVWSYTSKKFLSPANCGKYLYVRLSKQNKQENKYIHRLVAENYLQNEDNLPQVNHKDENTHNNSLKNLEWCSAKYNVNYGSRAEKEIMTKARKRGYTIFCVENGKEYLSCRLAGEDLGIDPSGIMGVINGKYKQMKGYHFTKKYVA